MNERVCLYACEFGWIPFCVYHFPFECIYRLFESSVCVSAYEQTNQRVLRVYVYDLRKFSQEGVFVLHLNKVNSFVVFSMYIDHDLRVCVSVRQSLCICFPEDPLCAKIKSRN